VDAVWYALPGPMTPNDFSLIAGTVPIVDD
jgi:hypothetical protein